MTGIFISYSHRDKTFVQRLYDALIDQGFDTWMDSEKLIGSADWWEQIRQNIESRACVIYVVTNESLASEVCTMEVHHALKFNKRLIPIILMKPDEKDAFDNLRIDDLPMHIISDLEGLSLEEIARKNWRYLTRYHWIFFDEDEQFNQRLNDLVKALNYDAEYVARHNGYLNRAIHWDYRERHSGFLLSRVETREMQHWLNESTAAEKDPPPHNLHKEFLAASLRHMFRQRIRAGAMLIGAIAITVVAAIVVVSILRDRILSPPPRILTGGFNVAIAPILEDVDGKLKATADGQEITNILTRTFANFVNREDLVGFIDFESERIPAVTGTTPEVRERAAADIAQQVNAHAVVYGQINADNALQLRIYVDPLFSGGEELAGETRFGAPIPLRFAEFTTTTDVQEIEDQILPRNQALIQFLYGLSLTNARSIDRAAEQFISAGTVEGAWDEDSGQEVVLLWLGTAYNNEPFVQRVCRLLEDSEESSSEPQLSLFCARTAYEAALAINEEFARAYIGLGNVHMNIGSPDLRVAGPACHEFDRAIEDYNRALELKPDEEYAAMTLLEVKANANIGRANTRPLYLGCSGDWYTPAIDAFEQALSAIPDDTDSLIAEWEAANILFWIGRTHRGANQLDRATSFLNQAIAMIDTERWPQRWQHLLYEATLELAYVYQVQAEDAETDRYQDALDSFQLIVDAANDPKTGYDNVRIISQAYFGLGLLTETREGCEAALPYYNAVLNMDENLVDLETFIQARSRC